MIYNPSCPNCDIDLEWSENGNMTYEGDYIRVQSFGFCPHCEKNFSWDDIYTFDEFENLKCIED